MVITCEKCGCIYDVELCPTCGYINKGIPVYDWVAMTKNKPVKIKKTKPSSFFKPIIMGALLFLPLGIMFAAPIAAMQLGVSIGTIVSVINLLKDINQPCN